MSDTEQRRLSLLAALVAQAEGTGQAQRLTSRDVPPEATQEGVPRPDRQRIRGDRNRQVQGGRPSDASQKPVVSSPGSDPARRQRISAPVTPFPQLPDRQRSEDLPQLPQRQVKRSYGTLISFLLFVALPIAITSVYYIYFASYQYAAEFRFAVRETTAPVASATASTLVGAAGMMGIGASSNFAENYMVADYLTSRQIVDELQAKIKVKELYGRPSIDWWSRFDPSQPMERFVTYWQGMVSAEYDQITGIAIARVRAFTPDDAYLIATTMVSFAEKLINDVAMRPRRDAVQYAEREVKRAQDRLTEVRAELSLYRDTEAVIDPTSNVVASNTTLAQTLRATLVQYQTELAALTRQNLRASAPAIVAIQSRIHAAKQQLAEVEAQVATAKVGGRPLSHVVAQYEKLDLERQVAQNILTSAIQSLEQARVNASVQPLYITPFVQPARPESSTYPRPVVAILTVGLACFFLWTIGLLIVRSIREHLA